MSGQGAIDRKSERSREEAALWHARLAPSDITIEDWQDFTVWLEADALNRASFDNVECLAAELMDGMAELRALVTSLMPAHVATHGVER